MATPTSTTLTILLSNFGSDGSDGGEDDESGDVGLRTFTQLSAFGLAPGPSLVVNVIDP